MDECVDNNGGCEDVCINMFGVFYCYCENEGYVVYDNRKNCIGKKYCYKLVMYR